MTLKEYKKKLDKFIEENPECLGMQVIYAIDDEGNEYKTDIMDPAFGRYEDGEFDSLLVKGHNGINAVCIN